MQQPNNKKKLQDVSPGNNKNKQGVVELSVLVAELFSGIVPLSVSKTFRSYPIKV